MAAKDENTMVAEIETAQTALATLRDSLAELLDRRFLEPYHEDTYQFIRSEHATAARYAQQLDGFASQCAERWWPVS